MIRYEHLHRYAMCGSLVDGKDVLDVASGEGYGSVMLARSARSVLGVDSAAEAVQWARRHYYLPNVRFMQGDCTALPLPDAAVDVVVSFETIEHHDRHDEMLAEIRRVLRPGGVLVISSPNRLVYTDEANYENPYHVKELYFDEFAGLLSRYFPSVAFHGQRLAAASFVYPLVADGEAPVTPYVGNVERVERRLTSLKSPVYFIAVCSAGDARADGIRSLFLDAEDDLLRMLQEERHELALRCDELVRRLEDRLAFTAPEPAAMLNAAPAASPELDAVRVEHDAVRAERGAVRAELDNVRSELATVRAAFDDVRAELGEARAARDTSRAERDALAAELGEARSERDALRAELDAAAATGLRLENELAAALRERDEVAHASAAAAVHAQELELELARARAELDGTLAALVEQERAAAEALEAARARERKLAVRLDEQTAQFAKLTDETHSSRERYAALETRTRHQAERLAERGEQLESAERRLANQAEALANLQRSEIALRRELVSLTGGIDLGGRSETATAQELHARNDAVGVLTASLAATQRELAATAARLADTEAALAGARVQVAGVTGSRAWKLANRLRTWRGGGGA